MQFGSRWQDLLTLSGMPFVFLTSRRDTVPKRHANRLVVNKPYSTEALLAVLDRTMSEDQPAIFYPVAPPAVSWPRVMPQL